MSEKPAPKQGGGIPTGAAGLVLTIMSCVGIVVSPVGLFSLFLNAALGFAGLAISIVGIAKGSGRAAGALGVFVFILGCLMTYATLLDFVAYERRHSG